MSKSVQVSFWGLCFHLIYYVWIQNDGYRLVTKFYLGHVDPGENDMETALRETREEAGLEGHHLQVLEDCRTELHYEVRGKPKTVVYWLAKLLDPQTTAVRLSDEHRDFKWGNLEESCRLITDYPDLQAALRQCQTFLLSASNNP